MKTRIPPTHTLVALDALARLGTVWEAAEELGISRSGVSHRLAMLEEILGFELATRAGTGVVLTPRGKSYAEEVRKSLALLTSAQQDRASRDIEGVLRVSSTAGFSSMWLCKHIALFHEHLHPRAAYAVEVRSEKLVEALPGCIGWYFDRVAYCIAGLTDCGGQRRCVWNGRSACFRG